ncbi:MAG: four helix bundle protein [Clostridiales bacterium]|nr:four helix bundle protein [Clostridiales bacterium]
MQELTAITKARELGSKVFAVTEKSPKKYRFTIVSRLQNLSLEVISDIGRANEVFVDVKLLADLDKSIKALSEQKQSGSDMERYHVQNKLLTLKLTRAATFEGRMSKRVDLQHEVLAKLKEMDFLSTFAKEQGAILPKQHEQIAGLIWEVSKLVGAWVKADRRRYNY